MALPIPKRSVLYIRWLLLVIYLIFCSFMVQIVVQYTPASTDTAFLGIKQEYISLPFYLAAFYIHVFTAILALPAGFSQFSRYVLKCWPQLHRLNGRVYVIAILVLGGPSGLFISLFANGGLLSRLSFCLLGVLWIYYTWQAYTQARRGNFKSHKAFMYRSFALTLSAITLRAWKYVLIAIFHPRPMDVYQLVAWLGWIPNLLIAEYLIAKNRL